VDDTHAYFSMATVHDCIVSEQPLNGSTPSILTRCSPYGNGEMTVTASSLIYVDQQGISDALFEIPKAGGTPTLVRVGYQTNLTNDGTNLYWLEPLTVDWRLRTMPLTGGAEVTLAQGLHYPTAIATDANALYIANRPQDGPVDGGLVDEILRLPRSGGSPLPLVTTAATNRGLAVDATSVYWANDVEGTIRKTAK